MLDLTPLLEGAPASWLATPEKWRWVHTLGFESAPPLADARERRFLARRENVHTPAHREIMLPLRGRGTFGLAGHPYARTPGTVFLFDHHEARNLRTPRPMAGSALWLHLERPDALTFNTVATDGQGRHYRAVRRRFLQGEAPRRILEAWDHCHAYPGDLFAWAHLKAQTTATLLAILAEARPDTHPQPQAEVIHTLCAYIRTHLGSPLSTPMLASLAGYSPTFFHRLFLQETGATPKAYIDRLRAEKAREMLTAGHALETIAEAVGMASAYSFSRFFRQQTGLPPRRWGRESR